MQRNAESPARRGMPLSVLLATSAFALAPVPGSTNEGVSDGTVLLAPCLDAPGLTCAVGIEGLSILGTRFDVDFRLGNYTDNFPDGFPYFFGDADGARAARDAIQQALNDSGAVFGANGQGTDRSRVDIPSGFQENAQMPWTAGECSLADDLEPQWSPCEFSSSFASEFSGPDLYRSYSVLSPAQPLPLSAVITGANALSVVCVNSTTGERITAQAPGAQSNELVDCQGLGLEVSSGDRVRLVLRAASYVFGTISGSVRRLGFGSPGIRAVCTNITRGDQVAAIVIGRGWDCFDAGLVPEQGDVVVVTLSGIAE